MKLNPYLNFAGNAEEALNFYKDALNGEIQQLGRYGDSPMPCDENFKNKIMHARLVFDDNLIMVSDVTKEHPVNTDGNIQMSLDMENEKRLDEVFHKMAAGGKVTFELQDTFWGARFGMLKDKFGVNWMFNCDKKK